MLELHVTPLETEAQSSSARVTLNMDRAGFDLRTTCLAPASFLWENIDPTRPGTGLGEKI